MKTNVLTPATSTFVEGIQVSGLRCFEGKRWREAILYYLFGIWADTNAVTYRPKINFDGITLKLVDDKYVAIGGSDSPITPIPGDHTICARGTQNDVEAALVRFVKNNQIWRLVIVFPKRGDLYLTKGRERGELVVSAENLPSWEEHAADLGYKI